MSFQWNVAPIGFDRYRLPRGASSMTLSVGCKRFPCGLRRLAEQPMVRPLRFLLPCLLLLSTACKAKLAAAAPGTEAPAGYTVINSTSAGRTLSVRKRGVKSVRAGLQATLKDLTAWFDQAPVVQGAYEDQRNHRAGGAVFTAALHGQAVKGSISCKLDRGEAAVAVIFAAAKAPQSEWAQLTGAPSPSALAGGEAQPEGEADGNAEQGSGLKRHDFPDGSGFIGLANGWHTDSQSCASAVVIEGPGARVLALGIYHSVVTPDSTAVQMQQQMSATAMQMGQRLPPFGLLVAPYSGPLDAVKNLASQLSQQSVNNHGAPFVLDHLAQVKEVAAWGQGGRAAVLTYGVTENGRKHYRVQATVETTNVGQGAWMLAFRDLMRAPDSTFARDLPVMQAMVNSWRTDAQVIGRKARENIDASNQRFAVQQQAHREQNQAFDQKNRGWERNQQTQSRSNDDFSEAMRGYRSVEDTRTGEKTSVDLGNVDATVDALNAQDPGRYQQIPLRDELDPR